MKALNNLVIQVSHSAGLFVFSAILAFGSLVFVFFNIREVFEPIVGAPPFDFQNGLSVAQIFEQLPRYDESAISLYYAFVFIDFFFPVFASLTLGAASAFSLRYVSTKWYEKIDELNLFAIYFIPAMFDWIENLSAIVVINAYPAELTLAAGLLVMAKKGKLATLVTLQIISLPILLSALLKWMRAKMGSFKSQVNR